MVIRNNTNTQQVITGTHYINLGKRFIENFFNIYEIAFRLQSMQKISILLSRFSVIQILERIG